TAAFGAVQLFDGTRLTLDAHYGISPDDVAMLQEQVLPMYPDRGSTIGRAVLSRAVVHVADIRADPDFRFTPLQIREGYRTARALGCDARRRCGRRGDQLVAPGRASVLRQSSAPCRDLRRPGRDRHRERPVVHGVAAKE